MISANILCDSTTEYGNRLTTFKLTYPRFIHSEFMTHRCFSRNAASSRAIPIQRQIDLIQEQIATPEYWGKNQSGMSAAEHLSDEDTIFCRADWEQAADDAIRIVKRLMLRGCHKQIANRLLEPFQHITVIATASERGGLSNFFALRAHPAAQPEFQVLSYRMLKVYLESKPKYLVNGEWHMPFDPGMHLSPQARLAVSVAHCARISYMRDEESKTLEEDRHRHDEGIRLHHMSPFEHQAKASSSLHDSNFGFYWNQYRKCLRMNAFTNQLDNFNNASLTNQTGSPYESVAQLLLDQVLLSSLYHRTRFRFTTNAL